eukprot:9474952-Pyramimonas_sp.AAC.1
MKGAEVKSSRDRLSRVTCFARALASRSFDMSPRGPPRVQGFVAGDQARADPSQDLSGSASVSQDAPTKRMGGLLDRPGSSDGREVRPRVIFAPIQR